MATGTTASAARPAGAGGRPMRAGGGPVRGVGRATAARAWAAAVVLALVVGAPVASVFPGELQAGAGRASAGAAPSPQRTTDGAGSEEAGGQPGQDSRTALAAFNAVWQAIRDEYVGPDFKPGQWENLRDTFRPRVLGAPTLEAAYGALAEMVRQLNDRDATLTLPWQRPEQPPEGEEVQQEYAGIGVVIDMLPTGEAVVVQVLPGSPAERAGLLIGDVIVAVDGQWHVPGENLDQLARRIRGPAGSRVRLTLRDAAGVLFHVTVVRQRIDLRLSVQQRWLGGGIAYLRVPAFTGELMGQAARALTELMAASALVLDLRGVGTGGVEEMARLATWLLGPADLGSYVTREGSLPLPVQPEAMAAFLGPLVLLTDGATASVGEVLALVLQEYGRARLVGTPTRGGPPLTRTFELPGGGLLQLPVARYRSPKGHPVPAAGLTPDIPLSPVERRALRERRDLPLERAVEALMRRLAP